MGHETGVGVSVSMDIGINVTNSKLYLHHGQKKKSSMSVYIHAKGETLAFNDSCNYLYMQSVK